MFEAVILMGGFGTRLKSITGDTPKPMVLIGGEPFVYMLMKKLESAGCSKIVLSLHYGADYIISKIETDRPVKCQVSFAVEEKPLGTGGAIKYASHEISGDRFLVLNGDTYAEVDYQKFFNRKSDRDLVVLVHEVPDTSRYGCVVFDEIDFKVLKFNEKETDRSGYVNAGSYVINKSSLVNYDREIFSFESDFLPEFSGDIRAYVVSEKFVDIGVPQDYAWALKHL